MAGRTSVWGICGALLLLPTLPGCGQQPSATKADVAAAAAPLRRELKTVLTAFGAGATPIPDTYQKLPRIGGGDVQVMWFVQLRLPMPPDARATLDRRIAPALARDGWSMRDWSSDRQLNRSFQSARGILAVSLSRTGLDMVIGATGPTLNLSPEAAAAIPETVKPL